MIVTILNIFENVSKCTIKLYQKTPHTQYLEKQNVFFLMSWIFVRLISPAFYKNTSHEIPFQLSFKIDTPLTEYYAEMSIGVYL
jgi:hypothetical protein